MQERGFVHFESSMLKSKWPCKLQLQQKQGKDSTKVILSHRSVVALVDANEVILQDLHLSAYPGVNESALEHFQLHRSLCSGSRCNQTADEDPQE